MNNHPILRSSVLLLAVAFSSQPQPARAAETAPAIPPEIVASPAALRAPNYEDALALAQGTGRDLVVLQRGSDWNPLGERIYTELWQDPAFAAELGKGFVLVAVDKAEVLGGQAVHGRCTEEKCGVTGLSETRIGSQPPLRLARATADAAPLPDSEITAVESTEKVLYTRGADGTFAVDAAETKNPAKDTLVLTMKTARGGAVLRLDFPTAANLPGNGPGRANNGNFVIGEIEVSVGGVVVKAGAAWSEHVDNNLGPWQAVDGDPAADKGWNAHGDHHRRRTLLVGLASAVPAGAEVSVRLVCQGVWGQHVPGTLRAAFVADPQLADDLQRVAAAQLLAMKNAKFSWWDGGQYPRIALMDAQGRAVAADQKPRQTTVAGLLESVRKLAAVRVKRDELWAQAAKAEGPAKAELLRQGLDAMGNANWAGNGNCYAEIHKQIREADPKDESGAVRWLGFGGDPRSGAPWTAKPNWNEMISKPGATDADFEAALASVDAELKDPRNKVLTHEQIQRIWIAKYHIYKRWPNHQEQRFAVQREIAAFDPDTFWGIGARGYQAMYKKSEVPMLTYGWGPEQVKPGVQTWDMPDTAIPFDHAGPYTIAINHAGGTNTVKVVRCALMDGATVVAQAAPVEGQVDVGPGKNAQVKLDASAWQPGRAYVLRVEIAAETNRTNNAGVFAINPDFVAPADWKAPEPAPNTDAALLARIQGDVSEWRKALLATLAAAGNAPTTAVVTLRKELARAELIRACTTGQVAAVAAAPGGPAFLSIFMDNPDWMESFLSSGPANYGQSLENLRFLWVHAKADFDDPLFQRLATAMALSSDANFNRYRLYDRFKHVQRAWKEGLLHIGFADLTVRLMRFAIYMEGTARHYQYMLDDRQMTTGDYLGACWSIWYLGNNVYGDSVQAWPYHAPWTHEYLVASRQVGGVCGALSKYGAAAAYAHGVPSTTVGQPGHCAYIVRLGNEWPIGNDVSGPGATGFGAWGWEGTGYSTAARLWEPVEADRAAFLTATRLGWLAEAQRESEKGAATPARAWKATFEAAIAAQPLNYGTWLAYAKALEADPAALDDAGWAALALRAAKNFAVENQAGFAMAQRCAGRCLSRMTPPQRVDLLLAINRELTQEKWDRPLGYDGIHGNFNWQSDQIGDPKLAAAFFGELLSIHRSENPNNNWIFAVLMGWGANRFAGNPATSAEYTAAVEMFFTVQGGKLDAGFKAGMIAQGIRKSSESGDLASYRQWSAMAAAMLPALQPGDVHLNPAQAAAAPKHEPFPGVLLSKEGMLRTSTACGFDKPLSYAAILDGSMPGWFDTNNEEKPWAEVQLAGDSDVSGIVLLNRYEYAADQEEFKWAAPLKVSVSTDGKAYTEVARVDQPEALFRIDLQGKAARARFVRIERPAPADGSKPGNGRWHFRRFLVYGKKLY